MKKMSIWKLSSVLTLGSIGVISPVLIMSACGNKSESSSPSTPTVDDYFVIDGNNVLTKLTDEGRKQTKLQIPNKVVTIGENAFLGNTTIETITFEANSKLTIIGDNGFSGCTKLVNFEIPSSVTHIDMDAFQECKSLTTITIPNSVIAIANNAFYNCQKLKSVKFEQGSKLEFIEDTIFSGCSALSEINLPENISRIGSDAFRYCQSLPTINIPSQVESIGWGAFDGCSKLDNIILPDKIKSIEQDAFNGCSALTKIKIPASVTSIGANAFAGCTKLTTSESVINKSTVLFNWWVNNHEYDLQDGSKQKQKLSQMTNINDWSKITNFDGKPFTKISAAAFAGLSALVSVTIPDSITSIEAGAFSDCASLTTVVIPATVNELSYGVFSGCKKLNDLKNQSSILFDWWVKNHEYDLHDGFKQKLSQMTNIDDWSKLTNSDGNPFTKISTNAFGNCTGLESITIPNTIEEIGSRVFEGCKLKNLTNNSTNLFDWWVNNHEYTLSATAKSTLSKMSDTTDWSKITNSDSQPFTKISDYAFYDCQSLQNIVLPQTITSLGKYAFQICQNLINVTLPNSVTFIGNKAFISCLRAKYHVVSDVVKKLLLDSESNIYSDQINLQ